MRKGIIILSIMSLFVYGCGQATKTQTATGNDPGRPRERQILDRLLPGVMAGKDSDAGVQSYLQQHFPGLEIFVDEDGSIRYNEGLIVISRMINDELVFAFTYSEVDSLLVFYRLNNESWKETGRRKPGIPVGMIYSEELNGKPGREVIVSTWPNMNSNSWKECFVYFPEEDTIRFAGSFSTDYEVDLKNRTISETYEGSNYMSPHKTLYGWHEDHLVPLRTAVIVVPEDWNTNEKRILEYYEAHDYNCPMRLVFSETYDKQNKKHDQYWNHFFGW